MKYFVAFMISVWSFFFKRDFNYCDLLTIGIIIQQGFTWTNWQFYAILFGGLMVSAFGSTMLESINKQHD
jgi:hypothetical protein